MLVVGEVYRKAMPQKAEGPGDEGLYDIIAKVGNIGVVDAHNDVFDAGSVGNQEVLISWWNHAVHNQALPVGKGLLKEQGDGVFLYGKYFSTGTAQELRDTLKEMGDTEWSVGYRALEISTPDDNKDKAWHVLKADVFEVSPVLRGAQPGTHTISQKADETAPTPASNQPETKAEADPLFAQMSELVATA